MSLSRKSFRRVVRRRRNKSEDRFGWSKRVSGNRYGSFGHAYFHGKKMFTVRLSD